MGTLIQDLRYGLRMLAKNPGFTAVAVLTLALGIGANTAIFSVVNAVLLRPLPYPDSDRLVQVWSTNPRTNRWGDWVSYPNFVDWREQNKVFENIATYRTWVVNITGGDHPEALRVALVSSSLFSVLHTQPMFGRSFLPEEDHAHRNRVVIVSYGLWQGRFGSDPGLIGKTVQIESQSHTVAGIMPPGFDFPESEAAYGSFDAWIPLGLDPGQDSRGSNNYRAVARLKPGISIEQAQANMEAIARSLAERYPEDRNLGVRVAGLQENVAKQVRPALRVLLGAIGLVLLIACANVANLLLARGATRQREAAIRQALGASRGRMIRQLLAENTPLALLGGVVGLLFAFQGVQLLVGWGPNIPRLHETTIDPRVLAFTLMLSLAAGLIFSIVPALKGSKIDLHDTLKESGSRSTMGVGRGRTRSVLVVAEMALALMLLISAGLLIRSFLRLEDVDLGFSPDRALTAMILLPRSKYTEPHKQAAFFKAVVDRIEALPGVDSAGGSESVPLVSNNSGGVRIEGRPEPRPGGLWIQAERAKITPDYFRAMGIRLLRGRTFTWADNENALAVAIIDEAAAQLYWPNEDPIGKQLSVDEDPRHLVWRQVVGIVRTVRHDGLQSKPRPGVYIPLLQSPTPFMIVAVRTRVDPGTLSAAIRREVMGVDKDQPIFHIQTMEQVVSDSVANRRFQMTLLAIFAALALCLAAIGIYGVISYSVSQRTHEIGIRVALGAEQHDVLKLVVGQGMLLTLTGIAIGLLGAFAVTRALSSLLYGIRPIDPVTFAAVSLLLAIVALLASYIPARRATKVDPMVALRYE